MKFRTWSTVWEWLKRADSLEPSAKRTWIIVVGRSAFTFNCSLALKNKKIKEYLINMKFVLPLLGFGSACGGCGSSGGSSNDAWQWSIGHIWSRTVDKFLNVKLQLQLFFSAYFYLPNVCPLPPNGFALLTIRLNSSFRWSSKSTWTIDPPCWRSSVGISL